MGALSSLAGVPSRAGRKDSIQKLVRLVKFLFEAGDPIDGNPS